MKHSIWTVLCILISSALTFNFSTLTHPIILLTVPGILFGLALTAPHIFPDTKNHWTEIKLGFFYPIIWAVSMGYSIIFHFFNASLTSYIFEGLILGFAIFITFDWQFGFKNKKVGILTITFLSIAALLLADSFFPSQYDKELNIGKQIALWQIFVGLGIVVNKKRQ